MNNNNDLIKKTKYKNVQISLLYASFIIYIGIQPIIKVLNYIDVNISIKKSLLITITLLVYGILAIGTKETKKLIKYKNPIFLLIIIITTYIFAYSYVKDYGLVLVRSNDGYDLQSAQNIYFDFIKNNLIYFILFSLIGLNIQEIQELISRKKVKKINRFIYVALIISFIVLSFVKNIGIFSTLFIPDIDNGYYLYIGDSFALLSILLYKYCKHKDLFLLNSIFWLYKIGSRTALICFLLYLLVDFTINFLSNKCVLTMNIMKYFIIIPIIFCIIVLSDINIDFDDRMLSVFNKETITNDNSYTYRNIINEKNIKDLENIWLTGKVFRELEIHNRYGFYCHNIVSYWIQFGIITFILIILSLIILVIRIIKSILKMKYNNLQIIIGMTIFLLPEVLFSRSYTYPYIWLLIFGSTTIKYNTYLRNN